MIKKLVQKVKIVFIPCEENRYRPKFLDSNFLFYYIVFLLILKIFALSLFIYLPQSVFFASLTKEALIDFTNQERQYLGLNILEENSSLNGAALQKAQDMLNLDYFGHQSPEGKNPWYWFQQTGYQYQKAGENLAIGFLEAEEVFQAWNDSPDHKENIINPYYEDTGVAVLKGDFQGKEVTVVVQFFASEPKPLPIVQEVQAQETEEGFIPQESFEETSVITEEEKEEVAQGELEEQIVTLSSVEFLEEGKMIKFLKFMTIDYLDLVEKIVFYSLILIIIALLITVFVKISIQPKDLLVKGVFSILIIFALFIFLNKEILIRFIPHNLIIG